MKGVLMRRLMALLSLLLLVVGCSSGSDSGDIAFDHELNVWLLPLPADTSVWTATGESIDNDLLCSAATGNLEGWEDEDGASITFEELEALNKAREPLPKVTVESMTCDDGSGEFTLRFFIGDDTSIDGEHVTYREWTIIGGSGYDTTSGEGGGDVTFGGEASFYSGTGTITKD